MRRNTPLRTTALVLGAAALVACGGDGGEDAADAGPTTTVAAPTTAAPSTTATTAPPTTEAPPVEDEPEGLAGFDPANATYPGAPVDSFGCGTAPLEVVDGAAAGDVPVELGATFTIPGPGGEGERLLVQLSCVPGANSTAVHNYVVTADEGGVVNVPEPVVRADEVLGEQDGATFEVTGSEYGVMGGRGVARTDFALTVTDDGDLVADDVRLRTHGGGDDADTDAMGAAAFQLRDAGRDEVAALFEDGATDYVGFVRVVPADDGVTPVLELLAARGAQPGVPCSEITFDRFVVDGGEVVPMGAGESGFDPFVTEPAYPILQSTDLTYVASPIVALADRAAQPPTTSAEAADTLGADCLA